MTLHINCQSVLHILMLKRNEYVKMLLTNNTIESKHPNCIISQSAFLRLNTLSSKSLINPSYGGAGYSCQLLNLSRTFAGPRVAFLAAYQLRYTLDILCCPDSPLSSTADLSRNQVRLVNLAQKIFNRTNCPILVRKFFTNAFSAPSLLLANKFNRRFILVH